MFLQTINFRKISKHIFKQTRDYKGDISAIFSAVFQWQIQAYSHISWHNQAYLNIFKHNQPYLGIIQAYSDIFRTLCKHAILRTIAHLELEAHLEPCQRSTMKRFVKIVHEYIFLRKSQLLSRYQPFTFSTLMNMIFFNTGLIFTSEIFILM